MLTTTEKPTQAGPVSGLSVIAGSESVAYATTPRDELLRQLLDSRIAKNEREWCAAREIAELREALSALLKTSAYPERESNETCLAYDAACETAYRLLPPNN